MIAFTRADFIECDSCGAKNPFGFKLTVDRKDPRKDRNALYFCSLCKLALQSHVVFYPN